MALCGLLAFLTWGLPGHHAALAQPAAIILEIQIEGTDLVARGQILSALVSRVDESLNIETVSRDIEAIFRLGFFDNVRAEIEEEPGRGVRLFFVVEEKPRVVSIKVVGNTLIEEKNLFDTFFLKVGGFYSARQMAGDVDLIREAYRRKGYFKVKVRSSIERETDKSFRLTFIIEETPRLFLTDIRTHNNRLFSELEIKRFMRTAEVDCFSWVTDSGVFEERKINADLQVLASNYLRQGYIRVFIDQPKVKLIHNRQFSRIKVDLFFTEGEQYFTGKLDVTGDILGNKQVLLDMLTLETGNPYNPFAQRVDRFRLNEFYQEQGYAFVRVVPDVKINDDTLTVDVEYRIIKGDKAYVGRIEFQGNRETRDFVMRREFLVRENELYNGRKLRISQQNLRRLGYFAPSIGQEEVRTDVSNVLDIVTKVDETQTGTLQAQIGFSDQSGLIASVSVSKGNLFGRGQTARLSLTVGQRNVTRRFSFDFIEPHLLGSDVSSDSSVALRTVEDISELNRGAIDEILLSQGFGFPVFPLVRLSFTLATTMREFETAVREPTDFVSFTTSLSFNSVNHPIFPTSGSNALFAVTQVGGKILSGDSEYRRYRLRYRRFISLNETGTLVLMGRARLGLLEKVGNNVIPLEDRFRVGGISTLRGYDFAVVGGPFGRLKGKLNAVSTQAFNEAGTPLVNAAGSPVTFQTDARTLGLSDEDLAELRSGGIQERLFTIELLFPAGGDNLRGAIFYDAAQVNAESRQYQVLGEEEPGFFDLLNSVGVGFRIITPVGVIRFEYGRKLDAAPNESKDKFDFTISSLF